MPKISEFFGITIYVYYEDHAPPHFHAIYAEHEAVIRIQDLSVRNGKLPPRALGLVAEWATRHRDELVMVWREAQDLKPLSKIAPLE